jgi:manganese/zinc/iron transport system permease protein
MLAAIDWSWSLDGWIVAAGALCAVAASLLGNFLVLRKMSLLGDAISHAVLPGLAVAFFISGSRSSIPMFLGAVVVGALTAMFTEWIRGIGKVDEGASMGVVFTTLFALGLIMIVQAADHVDLDPGCVLYGAIETTPLDMVDVAGWMIPRAVLTLGAVAILNALFVLLFFKELKITSFDPGLATTTGINSTLMHYLLMILVAVTAVASFESVGNILVVAMFVVPPAAAYMLTDRLGVMVALSVVLAIASAVLGHVSALVVPSWFGFRSTTTSGMMAVAAGVIFLLAAAFGPRQGVVVRMFRRLILAWGILSDDLIGVLFRLEERGKDSSVEQRELRSILLADRFSFWFVVSWLKRRGEIETDRGRCSLTELGSSQARKIVRSHRLWEQYLVSHVGVDANRIHDKAETMEHFTDPQLRERLDDATDRPDVDPHGSPIPNEPLDE